MGERPSAASLLSHTVKSPLASVKIAAQLLRKHLDGQLNEKDSELLDTILRNASTLELRINKLLELSNQIENRIFLELDEDQLEKVHALKVDASPKKEIKKEIRERDGIRKVVIHADPDIADLIPKFLDNRQKDILAMESALLQKDFHTIRMLGHSMKGAGGGYGFNGVTAIGKFLEEAAKAENPDEIRKGILELAEYLRSVEVIYEDQ